MVKLNKCFYTSDLHFGSDLIAETRGFKNAKEWEDYYVETHNNLIKNNTSVIFVGDLAKTEKDLEIFNYLNGSHHFVLGNHDKAKWFNSDSRLNAMIMAGKLGIVVSHFPVHPCFFDGNKKEWINIHGHTHYYSIPDSRYKNICPDVNGLKPVTLDSLFHDYF